METYVNMGLALQAGKSFRTHHPDLRSLTRSSLGCHIMGFQPTPNDNEFKNQYTSTSTAASWADFTTSSNFRSAVNGSLSLADTAGTDSRKLNRKLLFTA